MDKLDTDIEDFYEIFWTEYITSDIVSDAYMSIHEEFIWEITFNAYELWRKDPDITVKIVARLTESYLKTMFNYLPPDNITFTKDLGENFFR